VVEPPAVHAVVPKPDNGIGAKLRSNFTPLLTDVDGDGNADVVVAIETSTQRSKHFAVLSGRDGHELARTAALLDGEDDVLAAVLGRRLLTASRKGQLSSYGLGDGSKQWTTALGARASTFCNPKGDESFVVVTDDQRQLAIDLTTGQQTATKARCSAPLTRPERGDDPRDRHDYDAPFGTESYHCGGVTVMGSENYTVADQCRVRAHVDTDRLDGLVGHRLWKFDRNWLVFGVRKPGAYVPMLGLLSNGKLVWKQSVPLDNPLEAREGSPQHVGLSQGLVIAAYALEKDRSQWLTAFAVADGARRWNVALPQNIQTISNLVSSPSRVFIQASEQLILLDATSGKQLAVVGDTK
jgi:outer membrane protein assembly factor BamB